MEIKEFNFSLTKDIHIDFCMCDLALSKWPACDNCTPKMPLIKNKVCRNCKFNDNRQKC